MYRTGGCWGQFGPSNGPGVVTRIPYLRKWIHKQGLSGLQGQGGPIFRNFNRWIPAASVTRRSAAEFPNFRKGCRLGNKKGRGFPRPQRVLDLHPVLEHIFHPQNAAADLGGNRHLAHFMVGGFVFPGHAALYIVKAESLHPSR